MSKRSSKRILGIDFGDQAVRLVELEMNGDKPKLLGFSEQPISRANNYREALQMALQGRREKARSAFLTFSGSAVGHVVKAFPRMPADDLDSAITWEIKTGTEGPAQTLHARHALGGSVARKAAEVELLISHMAERDLESVHGQFADNRFEVQSIQSLPFSLMHLGSAFTAGGDDTVAFFYLAKDQCYFVGFQNNEFLFYREITLPTDAQGALSTNSMEIVLDDISRYFTYLQEYKQIKKINRIVLCGELDDLEAYRDALATRKDVPVEIFDLRQLIDLDDYPGDKDFLIRSSPKLAGALGAVLQAQVDPISNLLPGRYLWWRASRIGKVLNASYFFVLGLTVLLLFANTLFLFGLNRAVSDYSDEVSVEKEIQTDIDKRQAIEAKNERYKMQVGFIERSHSMEKIWVPALSVLAQSLGPGTYLNDMAFHRNKEITSFRMEGDIVGADMQAMYEDLKNIKNRLLGTGIFFDVNVETTSKAKIEDFSFTNLKSGKALHFNIVGRVRTLDRVHFSDLQ